MHHLYHFFGAHKNIWRFRLIVSTVSIALFGLIFFEVWYTFRSIKENVSVPGTRMLYALIMVSFNGFVSYHLYHYVANSFSKLLTDNTLQQLSPRILSYYKRQIEAYSFHHPISWGDLYSYLRHLKITDEKDRNEAISQETLQKQKSCIQDLVK